MASIDAVDLYDELSITLTPINDEILEQLVLAATTDAAADEVTPPLSCGNQWTLERIEWLRNYHRSSRDESGGPDGPGRELTWAVIGSGIVFGSVRLKAMVEPGVFETGIWLTQTARGHGVGRVAMAALIKKAAAQGAREVRADTAAGNSGALGLLGSLGFQLEPANADRRVLGRLVFGAEEGMN